MQCSLPFSLIPLGSSQNPDMSETRRDLNLNYSHSKIYFCNRKNRHRISAIPVSFLHSCNRETIKRTLQCQLCTLHIGIPIRSGQTFFCALF